MERRIRQQLQQLYGAGQTESVAHWIETLLQRHAKDPNQARPRPRLPLTHQDAVLITYGDMIHQSGETPLQTLCKFLQSRVRNVVSIVHILPFYPYSSDDGFSVIDFYKVNPELGDWKDVERIGQSFKLMFDAVFNHMSTESEWFRRFLAGDPEFEDFFVTVEGDPDLSQVVRPRALPLLTAFPSAEGISNVWTTFSADQVDINIRNPVVLAKLLETLLFYVEKGARLIRLDAIAFLWKEIGTSCIHLPQTHLVIQFLRRALDIVNPEVLLVTETNVPHRDNISYFGDGDHEAQMVYNFALPPLTLHTLLTGNAAKLTRWAQSLHIPSSNATFFNFLASHDGIGLNPARGLLTEGEIQMLVDRTLAHGGYVSMKRNSDGSKSPYELNINFFDALNHPAGREPLDVELDRFVAAHAIMLSLIGVPGIYFHSLFGSRGDRKGAETSGIPRRINRQKLSCRTIEEELDIPGNLRARVFGMLEYLLLVRSTQEAFDPVGKQQILDLSPSVFAVLRTASQSSVAVLCIQNVTDQTVSLNVPVPQGLRVTESLVEEVEWQNEPEGIGLDLQSYQICWLKLGQ